jgi:hypothetical protein
MGHGAPFLANARLCRFSKHQVLQRLQERSFEPRPVNGKATKRQYKRQ